MPLENEEVVDAEIPSIWIKQMLMRPDPAWVQFGRWRQKDLEQVIVASSELVAEHGKRFWRDLNVPGRPDFPYIRWQIEDIEGAGVRQDVPRSYVTKQVVRATIMTVRAYPEGLGSYSPSRPAHINLTKCLTGVGYTPVINANGEKIGSVSQSRFLVNHRLAYTDEDTGEQLVELGIVAEITYN
jgi:hypothetical protein